MTLSCSASCSSPRCRRRSLGLVARVGGARAARRRPRRRLRRPRPSREHRPGAARRRRAHRALPARRRCSWRGARCADRSSRGCAADETRAREPARALAVVALLGCGGDARRAARAGRLDGERDVARHDGIRRARAGPGEPLVDRRDLDPSARGDGGAELARFGVVTDAHVRDEESPARATFLDRLGGAYTLDVPPPGGAHDAGPRRRAARPAVASARARSSRPATSSTTRSPTSSTRRSP